MAILAHGPSLHEVAYQQMHGCCFFCGTKIPRHLMTLDHLTPIVRGGAHILANMVASCRACNSAKGAMLLDEFRISCGGRPFPGERRTA